MTLSEKQTQKNNEMRTDQEGSRLSLKIKALLLAETEG
jgi:hypothetical protein